MRNDYEDLWLTTLAQRRLRGDMIERIKSSLEKKILTVVSSFHPNAGRSEVTATS